MFLAVITMKLQGVNCLSTKRVSDLFLHDCLLTSITLVNSQLLNTGKFRSMDKDTDEEEHSIEMHIPYVYHVFQG